MLEKPVESVALQILQELGYSTYSYPRLLAEDSVIELIKADILRDKLRMLNPRLPEECLSEAIRQVKLVQHPSLIRNNMAFHKLLVEGVPVAYRESGRIVNASARLIDFELVDNNSFMAVSQMTVVEGQHIRRPDIVIFINGIPLAVIEVKNPADEKASIWSAYNQLQTYMAQIPSLFVYYALLIVTDGIEARLGTLSSGREWMMPWRRIDDEGDKTEFPTESRMTSRAYVSQMEVLLRGVFDKHNILSLIRYFTVFEVNKDKIIKKVAGYHQFRAVNVAVDKTVQAISAQGDRRCGVVWHTQGSR